MRILQQYGLIDCYIRSSQHQRGAESLPRARESYDHLDLPRTAKMRKFENWFDEHVIGQGENQFYDDVVGVEFS